MLTHVAAAIRDGLAAEPLTHEPLNALVVWTELGRGLCGTLDRKGADVGLLGRIIDAWCAEQGAAPLDLSRVAYQVASERRLDGERLARTLQDVQARVEGVLESVVEQAGDDGGKAAFIAAVKGWFPVGVTILRGFPTLAGADQIALYGALRAWCSRFLPHDTSGPDELGVRMTRDAPVH